MLWQIIFWCAGVLCLGYYILICAALRKWDSTFSRFWLAAGIFFPVSYEISARLGSETALVKILVLPVLVLAVTELVILNGMHADMKEECAYLIVLGAQVQGRRITDSLKRRLDRACEYLARHPKTRVVVSGGRGKGEDITEAEAMAEYLAARGIAPSRIEKEDRSRTTKENLVFSKAFLPGLLEPVGIVSNNFHLYRACSYARKLGYQKVSPVAAGCHPVLLLNYLVREAFAVWKMWLH